MSRNMDLAMYSTNDVLDALAKIEAVDGSAEDLASELTGLSIDKLWELGEDRLPYHFVHDIEWDTDGDSSDDLGLPTSCFIRAYDEDRIADELSDNTGFCVRGYCSAPSSREDVKAHVINVLFKEGYGRNEAEELTNSTSVLDRRFISDSTIIELVEEERRPV